MRSADLRIFSYLPNPRIWKAGIAARICGVDIDVRGAAPAELSDWLWDFDARPLSEVDAATHKATERQGRTGFSGRLHKTDAFLAAHPYGTVPAAFSPDGETGIFESNSIMRAVARLDRSGSAIYGDDAYSAARVDAFLDTALVFARDSQIYLLALGSGKVDSEVHERARDAFEIWLGGIERALDSGAQYLIGDRVTLADICFACELTLFQAERARVQALAASGCDAIFDPERVRADFPQAMAHYDRLCQHPAFAPDVGPYLEKLDAARGRALAKASAAPVDAVEVERRRRKREVALGYRIFAAQRWGDLGDGHISGRDPERTDCFWLLRWGVSFDQATVSDLVLLGPDGTLVEGEGGNNRAAYYIHHPILLARPDLVSAAHVHTGWGTPFSAEVRMLDPITQEACAFYEDHALFDDEEVQIQSVDGGKRIAEALGTSSAVILRNHGLLTGGTSVAEAVARFVAMERVAESHLKARDARPISPEAARFARADLTRPGAIEANFAWLVARHVGDPAVVEG
jgi:elongation factor 1-gamma